MILIYILIIIAIVVFFYYRNINSKIKQFFSSGVKGVSTTPEDFKIVYEPVFFRSSDGLDLAGWFVPKIDGESDTTVVVCPNPKGNKSDALKETYFLANHFNVFYFDFRASGESKGGSFYYGLYEWKDISAVMDFLKSFRADESKNIILYSLGEASFASLLFANRSDILPGAVILKSPCLDYAGFIKVYIKSKLKMHFVPDFILRKYIKPINTIDLKNIAERTKSLLLFVYTKKEKEINDLYNALNSSKKDRIIIESDKEINICNDEIVRKISKIVSNKLVI
ncbi:MAG: hypothetical protein KA059_03265 [Elusimicrobiales bacterium]|nr:hypothetical protein [Elusimicrobiales bacterium]